MQRRSAALARPTVVHNDDHGQMSRELVHRFQAPYFHLVGETDRPDEALELLDSGEAMVVVDVPPNFERSILVFFASAFRRLDSS